jgi:hypothetical protein
LVFLPCPKILWEQGGVGVRGREKEAEGKCIMYSFTISSFQKKGAYYLGDIIKRGRQDNSVRIVTKLPAEQQGGTEDDN